MCSYAEFCPCFARSVNLVGFCAVEANTAAANLFLMIQKLYKFSSSSTYLWEKLEDMHRSTATKHKLLVVKRLSDTHWSAEHRSLWEISPRPSLAQKPNFLLGPEYTAILCESAEVMLKAISADEGNRGEVQNEAEELFKRLSQLETCILLAVWDNFLERFQQTSSVLKREGIDLNTVVYLLEFLQVYVRGHRERYGTFEDQAKEKSGNQAYTKIKDNS